MIQATLVWLIIVNVTGFSDGVRVALFLAVFVWQVPIGGAAAICASSLLSQKLFVLHSPILEPSFDLFEEKKILCENDWKGLILQLCGRSK